MVIGILPDAEATESLLNNLSEAEFDLAGVSVLMRDAKQRAAIAGDAGPFKGAQVSDLASYLAQTGLAARDIGPYCDAVNQGKVLVAIAGPKAAEPAAREMLQDHGAQLIRGLP